MRPKVKKMILIAPFAIAGIALFIFLGGWIVMSLWNWLLPALFGWRMITFWQALGMLILCRILFGGASGWRGWSAFQSAGAHARTHGVTLARDDARAAREDAATLGCGVRVRAADGRRPRAVRICRLLKSAAGGLGWWAAETTPPSPLPIFRINELATKPAQSCRNK